MTLPSIACPGGTPGCAAVPCHDVPPPAVSLLILAGLATLSTAAVDMVVPVLGALARAFPGAGAAAATR